MNISCLPNTVPVYVHMKKIILRIFFFFVFLCTLYFMFDILIEFLGSLMITNYINICYVKRHHFPTDRQTNRQTWLLDSFIDNNHVPDERHEANIYKNRNDTYAAQACNPSMGPRYFANVFPK